MEEAAYLARSRMVSLHHVEMKEGVRSDWLWRPWGHDVQRWD